MHELLNPEFTKIEIEAKNSIELKERLKQTEWANKIIFSNADKVMLQMKSNDVPAFIRQVSDLNFDIYSIHKKHSLEDYFLSLTAD